MVQPPLGSDQFLLFFASASRFDELAAAEPGTFYLTDFLARHFERFVELAPRDPSTPAIRNWLRASG